MHERTVPAGYLGNLPEELGNLKGLETLDLSNGSVLTGLPQSFSQLTALSSARVEHFGASDLSGLTWLPKLRTLHLSGGRVPVELASCSQLTALTLLLRNVPEHQIELVTFTPRRRRKVKAKRAVFAAKAAHQICPDMCLCRRTDT